MVAFGPPVYGSVAVYACRRGCQYWPYHMVADQAEVYSIAPRQFAAQINYLAEQGYTAISLQE